MVVALLNFTIINTNEHHYEFLEKVFDQADCPITGNEEDFKIKENKKADDKKKRN